MRYYLIKCAFLILEVCWNLDMSFAQTIDSALVPLGTKTPYEPGQKPYTPPPPGFEPIFINYVGRHGARFLTKPEADVRLLEILRIASDSDALTARGKLLQKMVGRFIEIEKNNYGNITLAGAEEQKGIAGRMYQRNKQVFKGRGLEVTMTEEVRTEQSAKAFLAGLAAVNSEKTIHIEKVPDSLNDKLRFYDICPGYASYKKSPEVAAILDSLKKDPRTSRISFRLADEIFKPNFATEFMGGGIKIENKQGQNISVKPEWLAEDLYSLYSIHFSMQIEMKENNFSESDFDFGGFFDPASLSWIGFKSNAADFILKGPGSDSLGIQVTNSVPLLIDFINTTDSVLKNPGQRDACLRFAHAETISPFAALMGISDASSPSGSIFDFDKAWNASEIIPLSANIQWILYSNGNEWLVKILLNEKEVSMPIMTNSFPYYRWDDLRKYYQQKLKNLSVSQTADAHKYLLQLR
jgi:multiple inositol-polyphosphate phosphatase/2,3-bisphosphoglycerate 3-phosphatase